MHFICCCCCYCPQGLRFSLNSIYVRSSKVVTDNRFVGGNMERYFVEKQPPQLTNEHNRSWSWTTIPIPGCFDVVVAAAFETPTISFWFSLFFYFGNDASATLFSWSFSPTFLAAMSSWGPWTEPSGNVLCSYCYYAISSWRHDLIISYKSLGRTEWMVAPS